MSLESLDFPKSYAPYTHLVPTLTEIKNMCFDDKEWRYYCRNLDALDKLIRVIVGNKLLKMGKIPPSFKYKGSCLNCGIVRLDSKHTTPLIHCPWCQCPKHLLPKI